MDDGSICTALSGMIENDIKDNPEAGSVQRLN